MNIQKAVYRAREGEFAYAAHVSFAVRKEFLDEMFLELAVWLSLLDGIIIFFQNPSISPLDKFQRAYFLSESIRKSHSGVFSAAWLAHIELNEGRWKECCSLSLEALSQADKNQHDVLSRLALTLGSAFQYSGNIEEGLNWYRNAHAQALLDGDRLTVSSVLYNSIALRINQYFVERFFGEMDLHDLDLLHPMLGSSISYDDIISLSSLPELHFVLRMQYLMLKSKYSEARQIIDEELSMMNAGSLFRYRATISACLLLCRVKINLPIDFDLALKGILDSLNLVDEHDDRAVVFAIVSESAAVLGLERDSEKYMVMACEERRKHSEVMFKLRAELKTTQLGSSHWSSLYEK